MAWTICYALTWPMGSILISMGRIWFALAVGTIHNVLSLCLAWLLIPRLGSAGLALATSVAFLIANVPCVILLQRSFPRLLPQVRWYRMTAVIITSILACELAWRFLPHTQSIVLGSITALAFCIWRLHPKTNTPLPG